MSPNAPQWPARRRLARWGRKVGMLLLGAALPLAQAQVVPAIRVAGMNIPRGPLPPAALNTLDGLGTLSCPRPAGRLERVLYDSLTGQGASLSCGNRLAGVWVFPGEAASHPFQPLAQRIVEAKSSVLLANMLWDPATKWAPSPTPGAVIAAALAELRRRVLAHPEAYPQGMSVRLLLGNSPRLGLPADARANLDYAAADLLRAGLDLSGQPQGRWRLDVANFGYFAPHSHMKLLVLDGEEVWAGGFNISTQHLPVSAGGQGLSDLGLGFRGPVARQAAAAFQDSWQLSERLTCPSGGHVASVLDLRRVCTLGGESAPMNLLWSPLSPTGEAEVYSLYRRSGLTRADDALVALAAASEQRIDLLQAQVSGQPSCSLGLGRPRGCDLSRQGLPFWRAVAAALKRGVQVRLVLSHVLPVKLESLVMVRSLREAVAGTPAAARLQVRWASHPMHTKMIVVDDEMVVVGSTNLHYSSFGERGFVEYGLATSDPNARREMRVVFDKEWATAIPLR